MKSVSGIKSGYHALHRQWLVRRTPITRTISNVKLKILAMQLIVFCVLLSFNARSQISFSKTYYNSGWHIAHSFTELSDSGFMIVGLNKQSAWNSFSMRTDKYGDSIWTKNYGIGRLYDIISLSDSTFLATGCFDTSYFPIQISKLNLNGDTLWVKEYGYPTSGNAYQIEKTNDGGFVVVSSAQSQDYEFLKLDSNFNEEWHYNVYNMPNGITKIKPDPNGGYVAVGSGNVSQKPYVVSRFDSAGNQIWQYVYGNQPAWDVGQTRFASDIVFLADSNYLVCTDGFDWQLMKINRTTGDTIWTRNYYDTAFSNVFYFPISMDYAANNHCILANNGNNSRIILIDENGDTIWTAPKPSNQMNIYKIKETLDGGFAMSGYYYVSSSTLLLAFAKVDSLGNGVYLSTFDVSDNFKPVTFYPNPANTQLYISPGSLAAERNVTFTLYDMQGRVMLQQQGDGAEPVDVSAVPTGLYIGALKGKEKEVRGKVIIQR